MRNFKSVTHRTCVSVDVKDDGEVLVIVTRNNRTVERLDLAAEPGLNSAKTIIKYDWGVEIAEMVGSPAREEVVETVVFEGETRPEEVEV